MAKPFKIKKGLEAVSYLSPTSHSTTGSLDLSEANVFSLNLVDTASRSPTFVSPPATGYLGAFMVRVEGHTGVGSITWPSSVVWDKLTTPSVPANDQYNLYSFFTVDGGTTYYGKLVWEEVT